MAGGWLVEELRTRAASVSGGVAASAEFDAAVAASAEFDAAGLAAVVEASEGTVASGAAAEARLAGGTAGAADAEAGLTEGSAPSESGGGASVRDGQPVASSATRAVAERGGRVQKCWRLMGQGFS